ncbi:MAG: DNA repair exonuclease [Nanoarchaeota archaeon]|nr:DNA repair exonuclease [Nanoarchaeota archaeon]
MKISIFSDCHCGYAFGEERGEDSFSALSEAIKRSLDSDLILIAGDLFDSRIPKQEVFARTAKILSRAQGRKSRANFIEIRNKEKHEVSPLAFRGVPIVAIHGTHERRSRQMVNPVQALEHAGLLVHLHCATALFEIDGKKVAVHGMSGVPERFAKEVLQQWKPEPAENAANILMIHQSIEPYIYSPLEPPSLKLEDLPEGFDLYVLGHIHWSERKQFKSGKILLTGSTCITSAHKIESEQEKIIFSFDGGNIESVPLNFQRKIYYGDFVYENNIAGKIEENIGKILERNHPIKPIIISKITGTIPKTETAPNFRSVSEKFSGKAIIKIMQNAKEEGVEEQAEFLQLMREQKLSPEEHGLRLLKNNLEQLKCGLRMEEIFDLLADGETGLLYNMLSGRQKNLDFRRSPID